MACAGYLVWNNTAVMYAEITNGLLVCSASPPAPCEETPAREYEVSADATPSSNVLPLLAPKQMTKSDSPAGSKLKRRLTESQPEEEENGDSEGEYGRQRDSSASDVSSSDNDAAESRILRLCGHVVEVVDCEEERDTLPLLPFSFRVNTKKLTIHGDGSVSATHVDSQVLAAVDQKAKDEWVKRLARWNRYGWRETTYIAATESDCEALKVTMKRWHDALAHTFRQSSTFTPTRSSRRRFYRGAMEESMTEGDPWFNMRVIKTHI